ATKALGRGATTPSGGAAASATPRRAAPTRGRGGEAACGRSRTQTRRGDQAQAGRGREKAPRRRRGARPGRTRGGTSPSACGRRGAHGGARLLRDVRVRCAHQTTRGAPLDQAALDAGRPRV